MANITRHSLYGKTRYAAVIILACVVAGLSCPAWADSGYGWGLTQTLIGVNPGAPGADPLYLYLTPNWGTYTSGAGQLIYRYTYTLQNPNQIPPGGTQYPVYYYIDNFRLTFENAFPTILEPIAAPDYWHAVTFTQPAGGYTQVEWRLNGNLTPEQQSQYAIGPTESLDFVIDSPDGPSTVPMVRVLAGDTYGSGEHTFGPLPQSYSPPPTELPEWSSVFLALVGLGGLRASRYRAFRK